MLEIITKRGTLTLTLVGTGVASVITCSLDSNILDMGYVLARESVSTGFKVSSRGWVSPVWGIWRPRPQHLAPLPCPQEG